MKLIKCYISSFGKLKDFSVDFNSQLNVFMQENGWGKSTLASFIKAIFYGLNDSKRNVAENERTKFKPWNSTEKFGGYVELEWGGKNYRVERFFGNKSSDDTLKLIDLSTGKQFDNVENLGNRIFQIDEEGFLSTTYFSQKDFQVKSNTSLTAKFNSVCEIQDSEAFDRALNKLDEKAKSYKARGEKGLINDVKREIFALNDNIQRANLAEKTAEELKISAKQLEVRVEELKNATSELTKRVSQAGRAEAIAVKLNQYNAYKTKKEQLAKEKDQIEFKLNGQRPQEQEIATYIDCCSELEKVCAHEKILASDIEALKSSPVEQPKIQKNYKNIGKILAFSGLPCIIIAVILCVAINITNPIGIAFGAMFVVLEACACIALVIKPKAEPLLQESNGLLEQKIDAYNNYKDMRFQYETKLDNFISKYNLSSFADRRSALNEISMLLQNLFVLDNQINEINRYLAEIEKDNQIFEHTQSTENLSDLRKKLGEIQEEYARKANELANKRSDIKAYQDRADSLAELEDKKAELIAKGVQYKEDYEILTKTLDFLKKADENLKIKYRMPLQNSLNKYLSYITDNKKQAHIDVDLNVTVMENGADFVTDYYSKGYQNLFEICKRFALTDVLFAGEKPFIILDDPFYNLDGQKLNLSLELIKKLSKEYQILYFVCHESRRA